MMTAIREVRRARGLTLEEVARACVPPTTAQTIGRLETGARTVSVAWLNRIAAALGVAAGDLVTLPDRGELPVAAVLDGNGGVRAPRRAAALAMPRPAPGTVAVTVAGSVGDYRHGDELWCRTLDRADFGDALNRDVLAPQPGGRFAFGRLIGRAEDALHLLPPGGSARSPLTLADPPWIAVADRLVRAL